MPAITRLLGALVLVSVLAPETSSVARDLSPIAPSDAQSPEAVAIAMELLANRPVIRVTVNGQGPFPFLVGPEDQTTLIDQNLADALKVRERRAAPGGAVERTVELGFGPGRPTTVAVEITDIARFMPEFAQTVRPRGIVSLSLWKGQLVTIDYARWRLTLEPGTLPEPNGKDVFSLTEDRQFLLPLTIAERSVECRVDPLFPGGLMLPASYAVLLPLDGTAREWGVFNTREGTVRVKEAHLAASLMLGPFEVPAPVVLLAETGETAVVGTRWLGRFSLTYDIANARVRLERLPTAGR